MEFPIMFSDKSIPNLFTCLNLLCGCLAIVSVFHDNVMMLAGMVFLAAFFDFMDGMVARKLNAYSELGKQLDSLADMVTFGVVPGMVLHNMFVQYNAHEIITNIFLFSILKYFPFCVTVFAAFRLAKFNIDTRQTNSFLGMPTPAMGIFVTSLPLIIKYDHWNLTPLFIHPFFILVTSTLLSALMVSEIPLFALKFKNMKWNDNKIQFVFLLLSAILFLFFRFTAIPVIVCLYIILSIINNSILNRSTI